MYAICNLQANICSPPIDARNIFMKPRSRRNEVIKMATHFASYWNEAIIGQLLIYSHRSTRKLFDKMCGLNNYQLIENYFEIISVSSAPKRFERMLVSRFNRNDFKNTVKNYIKQKRGDFPHAPLPNSLLDSEHLKFIYRYYPVQSVLLQKSHLESLQNLFHLIEKFSF